MCRESSTIGLKPTIRIFQPSGGGLGARILAQMFDQNIRDRGQPLQIGIAKQEIIPPRSPRTLICCGGETTVFRIGNHTVDDFVLTAPGRGLIPRGIINDNQLSIQGVTVFLDRGAKFREMPFAVICNNNS